jgi:hypothetical protein
MSPTVLYLVATLITLVVLLIERGRALLAWALFLVCLGLTWGQLRW